MEGALTRSQNVEIADVLESGGYKVTNGAGRGPEEMDTWPDRWIGGDRLLILPRGRGTRQSAFNRSQLWRTEDADPRRASSCG